MKGTNKLTIALLIIILIVTGVAAAVIIHAYHENQEAESRETEAYEDEAISTDEALDDSEMSMIKIEGTDISISYRLLTDDEFGSYGKDAAVLGETDSTEPDVKALAEPGANGHSKTNYLVRFSKAMKSVVLCELTSELNEAGELSVYESARVDDISEIEANENIVICAGDVGETVPLSGIRAFDEDMNEYHFYIQLSGEDGSAILTQYDYSFLNLEGYGIYDETRSAAHLSGFANIDEALAYYDQQDDVPTWKVLWVVIDSIDADGTDGNGNTVHQKVSMGKEEEDYYLNDMSKQFVDSVYELSDHSVSIDMDTLLYTKPVDYLDDEYNCIMPDSFDDETIEEFKKYNSVICTVRTNEEGDHTLFIDWIGLNWGIQSMSYGFCEVQVDECYEENRFSDYPHHAEPWIHEWIHSIEPAGFIFDTTIASADGADDHGYPCEDNGLGINGFYKYYADILTANVRNTTGENEGFTKGMWRTMSAVFEATRGRIPAY